MLDLNHSFTIIAYVFLMKNGRNANSDSLGSDTKLELDHKDVKRMVLHPDQDVRALCTQKVCRQIRRAELSSYEQKIVNEILKLIVKDAAAMVRRALAITLQNSPNLPRDIAKKLILDVDSIAVPILSHSPVLNDDDLLEILKSKAAAKMMAITKRPRITGEVVKAIVRFGDSRVVASVAANDGAEIGADLGAYMLALYHDDDLIKESFIARRDLPSSLVEKLITMVSAEVAVRLNEKHEIPLELALDLASRSRERAQIDFISQSWVSRDLKMLTRRLAQEGRLTSTLIVRGACCGQMRFVEHALAQKSGVSLNKTALMVHDSGPFGLKTLCGRSGLNDTDFILLRASIAIFADLELKGGHYSKQRFQKIMLERVLSLPFTFSEEDQVYFLEKLDAVEAQAA